MRKPRNTYDVKRVGKTFVISKNGKVVQRVVVDPSKDDAKWENLKKQIVSKSKKNT